MTICIAAICSDNNVVAVTDKMLTVSAPVATRYEISENNKAFPLKQGVFALFAGEVTQANQIISLVKPLITEKHTVQEVANLLNETFKNYWQNILSNFLQMRYGIDLGTFMSNHSNFDQVFVRSTMDIISNFKINVEMLVAGKDEDGTAHIYSITNEGTAFDRSAEGYYPIGSGAEHAKLSLIESEMNSTFSQEKALFCLLKAKTRAEFDPGVGKLTDIIILNKELRILNNEEVGAITTLFQTNQTEAAKIEKRTTSALAKLME